MKRAAAVLIGLFSLACAGLPRSPPPGWSEQLDAEALVRACDAVWARGGTEALPTELAYLEPLKVWQESDRIDVRLGTYRLPDGPEMDGWGVVCTREEGSERPGSTSRQIAPRIWVYDGVM